MAVQMRRQRAYRVLLPTVMGSLSAALMVWDIHNQRVIMSMGMAWDTGAPLWPYQTPDILFLVLNFPAYIIGSPVSRLLDLLVPRQYFALFPAAIFWWWLVGVYLDSHRLVLKAKRAKWMAIPLSIVAVLLLALGGDSLFTAFRWWFRYSREIFSVTNLITLRLIAPGPWCFVLSIVSMVAAKNRVHSEPPAIPASS